MRRFLVVTAVSFAASCYQPVSYINRVVWSDDDVEHAFIELHFDERDPPLDPLNGTSDKKNFRNRLWVQAADGSNRREVGGIVDGQDGPSLFHMKRAGYFITSTIRDGVTRWERVRPDGRRDDIASAPVAGAGCEGKDVVPSPDGTVIAVIESSTSCGPRFVQVRFLDPQTLARVREPVTVSFGAGSVEWTFVPSGALVISDLQAATAVHPDGTVEDTPVPACFAPKSTSSEISSDGRTVLTDENNAIVVGEGGGAAFGCQ